MRFVEVMVLAEMPARDTLRAARLASLDHLRTPTHLYVRPPPTAPALRPRRPDAVCPQGAAARAAPHGAAALDGRGGDSVAAVRVRHLRLRPPAR